MVLLKILHFLALTVGTGFGLAGLVMMRLTVPKGADALAVVTPIRVRLGQLSALALLVLWVTGIWMWLSLHDGGAIGLWFVIKLGLVVALTVVVAMLNIAIFRAARGGPPPDPVRMKTLAQAASGLAVTIVICAVLAFA